MNKPRFLLSRRPFLAGLAATWALALAPGASLAFSVEKAKAQIGKVVGEIQRIINSGKSESAMYRDFESVLNKYADTAVIGQLVLGVDGRNASSAQKSAFARAFTGYIARKYGRRFREFIGGRVEVDSAKAVKSFYEVTTHTILRGKAPFEVIYVVADKNGKFIDMKVEGISLVKSERSEIGAMLDKRGGNLDRLIADLKTI